MILCWAKYKKKRVLFIALGTSKGKIIALKVQEPPAPALLSDSSISKIRSSAKKLMKMGLSDRLSEIKHLVSEWSSVYRTYDPTHLNISERHPISPS